MASAKHTPTELLAKRKAAKKMITVQGMYQKDVAAKLDVSENTLSRWVGTYRWQANKNADTLLSSGDIDLNNASALINISGFAKYLQSTDRALYQKCLIHLSAYVVMHSSIAGLTAEDIINQKSQR